jgi:hypothetical protein
MFVPDDKESLDRVLYEFLQRYALEQYPAKFEVTLEPEIPEEEPVNADH